MELLNFLAIPICPKTCQRFLVLNVLEMDKRIVSWLGFVRHIWCASTHVVRQPFFNCEITRNAVFYNEPYT